jgi:hypothetical protein
LDSTRYDPEFGTNRAHSRWYWVLFFYLFSSSLATVVVIHRSLFNDGRKEGRKEGEKDSPLYPSTLLSLASQKTDVTPCSVKIWKENEEA